MQEAYQIIYINIPITPFSFVIFSKDLTELILSDNKMLTEIDEYALAKNVTGANFLDYPPLEKVK